VYMYIAGLLLMVVNIWIRL